MSDLGGELWVLGFNADAPPHAEGCTRQRCHRCSRALWVTPASRRALLTFPGMKISCATCVASTGKDSVAIAFQAKPGRALAACARAARIKKALASAERN